MKKIVLLFVIFLTSSLWARFVQVNIPGFGDNQNSATKKMLVYKNILYTGVHNWNGTQIWKSGDGHHWLESTNANAGFGDAQNNDIYSMTTFKGDLYVGSYNSSTGGEVWQTSDGVSWNQKNQDGFGDANIYGATLCSNNGYLYAGIEYAWGEGSRIYRTTNPNPFLWTFISSTSNGFGNSDNNRVSSFCAFNGKLYAGMRNGNTGASIYESSDGTNWHVIEETTNGFHQGNQLSDILSMTVFAGQLYAGCDDGSIYRTLNGTNWEKSKNGSGFGGAGIYDFTIYSNYLYFGSLDSGAWAGALYRSSTGNSGSWETINNNGWGDMNNHKNYSLIVFGNALFVGNYNLNGTAVYSDLKFDYLYLTNYNAPENFVSAGTTNVAVMSFAIEDFYNHPITSLKIRNLGTMSNGIDMTNMKIWYDVNKNNKWDTNDIFSAGPAVYSNAIQKWCFDNVSVLPNTNLIVTIDIPLTGRTNYTFQGFLFGQLHNGDVVCSNGGTSINSISNEGTVNIGPHIYGVTKNIDLPKQDIGYSSTTVFSFHIQDTGNHKVPSLKITNLGTMTNSDVSYIKLYYDVDNNFIYSVGDILINSMTYNGSENKWVFQSGDPWPAPIDSNTNLIAVLYTSQNGAVSNTFKPFIDIGDVRWSCGAFNTSSISNTNPVIRIDEVVPKIISDIPQTNIYAGSVNNTILYFQVTNFYPTRTIRSVSVRNLGTAEDGLDISQMRLWRDTDGDKIGNVSLANGTYNSSTHLWYFGNSLTIDSTWDLVVTASLAFSARSNRTIKADIETWDIYNSSWVRNNQAITNQFNVIIKNTNDFVAIITNALVTGSFYTVTSNYQNKEVLDFQYIDTKGHDLKILNIANLSNMQAGSDIASVKVWQDMGIVGKYENGVDVYQGELVWNGVNKWTNSNLSIPEGSDVLVTIDTTPTINSVRSFRAYIVTTNDVQCEFGVSSHNVITNSQTLFVDLIPPDPVKLEGAFASKDTMKIEWTPVTNSDIFNYEVFYDVSSHPGLTGYSFQTQTSSPNVILTGLSSDTKYYYRVRSIDCAGNKSDSTNEGSMKTSKTFSLSLNKMQDNGLGSGNQSQQISRIISFQSNLYLSVMNWNGCKIYQSPNGAQFKQINIDGFGKSGQQDAPSLMEFNNYLYVGVDASFGPPTGCEIWRTPDGTNWQKVVDGGVEDTSQVAVQSMAVFNGVLYAGTRWNFGGTQGCEIWKTSDGTNWNKANTEGFGNANNQTAHAMTVFDNKLFVGVDNFSGSQVWWTDDGTTWHQCTEASNGFGNSGNSEIHSMIVYNNQLFATVYNWSTGGEIWATSNGTNWHKTVTDGYFDAQMQSFPSTLVYSNALFVGGYYNFGSPFIWLKTTDSTNWDEYDNRGFGNNNNLALMSSGIFKNALFTGTYNSSSGCELWSDIEDKVSIIKISDIPQAMIAPNQQRVTILNFKVTDLLNDKIDTIKLTNLGTMDHSEIASIQLWYDTDKNGVYSVADTALGFPAAWNASSGTWDFLFLNGLANTNLIATMDINNTVVKDHTFQSAIKFNFVSLSGFKNTDTAITNQFQLTISSNYYVQTNGNNLNTGLGWGTNQAWKTLQYAVSIVPDGSTIYVGNGFYSESVLFQDKRNIFIEATNKAIVSGAGVRDTCFKVIHSSNIMLKNFEQTSALRANLAITNSTQIFVQNNILHSSLAGINIQSAREISLINSQIYSNQYGLREVSVRQTLVSNNSIGNNSVQDMTFIVSQSNRIVNNQISGTNVGCLLYSGHDNTFSRNQFRKEKMGLYSSSSTNNIIMNNTFVSNTNGLLLFRSTLNDIKFNTISYSKSALTFLSNSEHNIIHGNTNSFNQQAGIAFVDLCSSNRIYNNVFYSNDRSTATNGDILLMNSSHNSISNNLCLGGNSFFAIASISNSLDNRIIKNQITNGYTIGIGLEQNSQNYVSGNNLSELNTGIWLQSVTSATLISNHIYDNTTNGMALEDSTNLLIAYNNIEANGEYGVFLSDSAHFTGVYQNSMNNNKIGLRLINSPISNILHNNFDNITYNLYVTGTSIPITNNWWGTTIVSNIRSTIISNGSDSQFVPYRLFGGFDITKGADITSPNAVSTLTATKINSTNVALSWASSTGSTRYFIYQTADSTWSNLSQAQVIGITSSTNWTNTGISDGVWHYYVTALDSAPYTNESWYSSVTSSTIDSTGPTTPGLILPVNNFITNSGSIHFTWMSSVDTGVGLTNYKLKITNSSALWSTNIITDNTNIIVTGLLNGTNIWAVQAIDKYTNYSSWNSNYKCVVDLTPPVISLISPTSNSTAGYVGVLFNWNSIDSLSGVVSNRIDIDTDNNLGNGFEVQISTNSPYTYIFGGNSTNHWRIRAKDAMGNTNYSAIWSVIINTNLPIASLYSPILSYTNINNPEFVWSDESLNGCTSNIIQLSLTNDFSSIATTSSGNNSFTNWTASNLSTAQYYWRILTYKLSTTTWYTSASSWVFVDTNNPAQANLITPTLNSFLTNATIPFKWTKSADIGTGIDFYTIEISTNSFSSVLTNVSLSSTNTNLNLISETTYQWRVFSIDKVGNTTISSTNIFILDTTPPSIPNLITPADSLLTNSSTIQFVWNSSTDTISGVSNYNFMLTNRNSGWTTNMILSSTNITLSLADGTNLWKVQAMDKVKHKSSWSSTNSLSIDTTPPSIPNLVAPVDSIFTNSSTIQFVWNKSTDTISGISNYNFMLTNRNSGWTTNIILTSTNTTLSLSDGTNLWKVRASDKFGVFSGWSSTNQFVIDTVVPSITLISPVDNFTNGVLPCTFVWTASDGLSGILFSRIDIDTDNNIANGFEIQKTNSSPYTNIFSGNSTNHWKIWVKDKSGNTNSSSVRTLFINTNYHKIFLDITNVESYEMTISASNCPVLAFHYRDTQNDNLSSLSLTNLGTMSNGTDISKILLYNDTSTVLGIFNGTESLLGSLEYDSSTRKWTNHNLTIPSDVDILVTVKASSTLHKGKTFQASLTGTNALFCSGGKHISQFITNTGIITADITPPVFNGNYTISQPDGFTVKLSWPSATDSAVGNKNFIYNIYVSQNANLSSFNLNSPAYTTINSTDITISDLNTGFYYFIILAKDDMGNISTTTNTHSMATILKYEENLDNVKLYPIPVRGNQNLRIDKLTQKVNFKLYSVSGIEVLEKTLDYAGVPLFINLSEYNLATGVYMAVISDEKQTIKKKIIYIK